MSFRVYVIRNEEGKFYTGQTKNLAERLRLHNEGGVFSTKNRGPWRVVYREEYKTRSEAMHREKFLKTGKGREYLQGIIPARAPR